MGAHQAKCLNNDYLTNDMNDPNLIIIKLGKKNSKFYCFSKSHLQKLINESPYYVIQGYHSFNEEKEEIIFPSIFEVDSNRIRPALKAKQNMKDAKIIRLDEFAVDNTFVDSFNKGANTFELLVKSEKIVVIFKSEKQGEYNILTKLFSTKAISRVDFLRSQGSDTPNPIIERKTELINLPSFRGKSNDNIKHTINDIVKEFGEEFKVKTEISLDRKCNDRTSDIIDSSDIVYDKELIVIFDIITDITYCYTLTELNTILSLKPTLDKETSELTEIKNILLAKLYFWNIFVDALKLMKILNNQINTIYVKKVTRNGIHYYEPFPSRRKDILIKNSSDKFETKIHFENPFYKEHNGFVYRARMFNRFINENESYVDVIEWVKYRPSSNDVPVVSNYDDNPSIINYDEKGNKAAEYWVEGNIFKRSDNKPTKIVYYPSGTKREEVWFRLNTSIENNDFIQKNFYFKNGNVRQEEFYKNKKLHKENDEPALITYYNSLNQEGKQQVDKLKWFVDGFQIKRENNLSNSISFYESGQLQTEEWYDKVEWEDKSILDRINDPARILYFKNGKINQKEWFINGIYYREDFELHTSESYYDNEKNSIKTQIWHQGEGNFIERQNDLPAAIEYYDDFDEKGDPLIMMEEWFIEGKKNREGDLPAVIVYYKNGNIQTQEWWKNDELHREDDLPARIDYHASGYISEKHWSIYDEPLRQNSKVTSASYYDNKENNLEAETLNVYPDQQNEPSVIRYYDDFDEKRNQLIEAKEWFNEDEKKHRDDGLPAVIVYDKNGNIIKQEFWENGMQMQIEYFKDGLLHNENDLPAVITGNGDTILVKFWYQNGDLHRDNDLPAAIFYDENEVVIRQEWYQNGVLIRTQVYEDSNEDF